MGAAGWAVAARLQTPLGAVDIGTGLAEGRGERRTAAAPAASCASTARPVGLRRACRPRRDDLAHAGDGRPVHGPRLGPPPLPRPADFLPCIPATAPCSGNSSARCSSATGCWPTTCATARRFEGFERVMAETGVAIAAARAVAVAELAAAIGARRDAGVGAVFPWAELALLGTLEVGARRAARNRGRGRLLCGSCAATASAIVPPAARSRAPHRSDLAVGHGPKEMPAKVCSTGEQKALLIGLVLAHCDLIAPASGGRRAHPPARRNQRPSRPPAARRAVR